MKITDRVLIYANNSFINLIKSGVDFGVDLEKVVRVINSSLKTQAELQKIEIARGLNNDTDKEVETEENNFFKEVLSVKAKDNNEELEEKKNEEDK